MAALQKNGPFGDLSAENHIESLSRGIDGIGPRFADTGE